MGSCAFAPRAAGGGEGEPGFDVVLDPCGGAAGQEEDAEEGEGRRPGVEGVDCGGEAGGDEPEEGEAVA